MSGIVISSKWPFPSPPGVPVYFRYKVYSNIVAFSLHIDTSVSTSTPAQVTMLHGAAEDVVDEPAASADVDSAATGSGIPTTAAGRATSPTSSSAETQEQIARFNERSSGRRRTPWQVIEDAPLLLRRLVSDLRRGDTQVFGELIRRGVQLHLLVIALYILSPVSVSKTNYRQLAFIFCQSNVNCPLFD